MFGLVTKAPQVEENRGAHCIHVLLVEYAVVYADVHGDSETIYPIRSTRNLMRPVDNL